MSFLIGLLTVVLVLDCLLLILLVLIQLPKKEAGAGVAFGGAATDALFGAGTGNVLTKATKYATIAFFVLLLLIGVMQNSIYKSTDTKFKKAVEQEAQKGVAPLTPPPAAAPAPSTTPSNVISAPVTGATNAPAAPVIVPAATATNK
jgi:preprotein translocase subunit SecG